MHNLKHNLKCLFQYVLIGTLIVMMSCLSSVGAEKTSNEYDGSSLLIQYCKYDFDGARLNGETWTKVKRLVAWEDEPGWDTMIVVKAFNVGSPRQNGIYTEVPVTYDVIGNFSGAEFNSRKTTEIILFKLKFFNGVWRIMEPIIPPHVSRDAMIHTVLALVKNAGSDSARGKALLDAIQRLNDDL